MYPSDTFKASYDSNTPEIYAAVVAITFACVAIVFFVYDLFVFKRNENLVNKAAQTMNIVNSIFPGNIRDRIMDEKQEQQEMRQRKSKGGKLKAFMKDGSTADGHRGARKPLADLFLETTICFADISNFTAI